MEVALTCVLEESWIWGKAVVKAGPTLSQAWRSQGGEWESIMLHIALSLCPHSTAVASLKGEAEMRKHTGTHTHKSTVPASYPSHILCSSSGGWLKKQLSDRALSSPLVSPSGRRLRWSPHGSRSFPIKERYSPFNDVRAGKSSCHITSTPCCQQSFLSSGGEASENEDKALSLENYLPPFISEKMRTALPHTWEGSLPKWMFS